MDIASDGVQGFEMAQNNEYDLIFMDLEMPELDGFGCTTGIRHYEASNQKKPVPIVALTAHAIAGYREKCLSVGMNDFLTKPIGSKLLLDAARSWILGIPTALVVDDSIDSQLLLERLLQGTGQLRVICADNGGQALQVINSTRVTMVFLDYELPDMPGPELARKLTQHPNLNGIPLIAVTGRDDLFSKRKLLESGCSHVIIKPVRQKNLVSVVGKYVDVEESLPQQPTGFSTLNQNKEPKEVVVHIDDDILDLIPGFIDNRKKDIEQILKLLAKQDHESIRRLGHNWKGAGRGYGFDRISVLGKEMEAAAQASDSAQILQICDSAQYYLKHVQIKTHTT